MNSSIYRGTLIHKREYIKDHLLKYKVFMFYLDLDEIQEIIKKIYFISYNKFNLYSLYDKDHFFFQDRYRHIKENLIDYLKSLNLEIPDKIFLLTNLRFLGYVFNPVSFYYCFKNQRLIYILSEVNNTFNEQKPILLNLQHQQSKGNLFIFTEKKNFYVSPFVNYDTDLLFRFNVPQKYLLMQVDSGYQKQNHFEFHVKASLSCKKVSLTNLNLLKLTLFIPFITFKVIFGIHWHAFLLWLKKIPFYKKAEIDFKIQKGEIYANKI